MTIWLTAFFKDTTIFSEKFQINSVSFTFLADYYYLCNLKKSPIIFMNTYSLYTYEYCPVETVQHDFFISQDIKIDMSTKDKNFWLDHLFGDRNTDVRIQRIRKRSTVAEKFPCKVLAHGSGRVVWLRLENEKIRHMWLKHQSCLPHEPDVINKENVAENPFSHIFLDFREGRNLIAIMKENDAWRNTDVAAQLLQDSLNMLMQGQGYGFGIIIKPVTVTKDFWDYNRQLILKDRLKVKKMTIYFGTGTLDPRVLEYINKTPILKHLLKEVWEAKRGKLELDNPLGPRIVDKRKRDIKNIIEMIGSNLTSEAFGLSLAYENGQEVVCGKDVRLMFPMNEDTFLMLFSQNLFGEYNINEWLDRAVEFINTQKNGTTTETKRNRKAPKHVQDTPSPLDMF
jgi:hypothetical protein